MFGLEGKDTEKVDFSYDIEKDLRDPKKSKEIKEELETRILNLKNLLRQGEDKEMFDTLGTLLHGYMAMKKVLERCNNQAQG
jgi:hypothetical protein